MRHNKPGKQMHILELPSIFYPRGGGFCLDQAKALAQDGHKVRVLSCVELGITETTRHYLTLPFHSHLKQCDGIEVYQHYLRRVPHSIRFNNRRWLNKVITMFGEYVRLYGKPDLIHAHSVHWAGYAAYLINQKWNIPYVITEHSSKAIFEMEFGQDNTNCWQLPLLRLALHNAHRVIPVSEELVSNLSPLLGTDYKYTVISNTIDTELYKPKKRSDHDVFRFVYPAVYMPLKAHEVLFEAFALLKQQKVSVELHLAGRGTDGKKIRKAINSSGISDMVCLHGQIDKKQMAGLYHYCDCMISSSRSEAQPLICLEAAATGMPFIATECTPLSLRFDGMQIVPVDNPDALAEAMKHVMNNSEVESDQLYNKVCQIASPQSFAKSFNQVIKDL